MSPGRQLPNTYELWFVYSVLSYRHDQTVCTHMHIYTLVIHMCVEGPFQKA